jgi:hypothetical protein
MTCTSWPCRGWFTPGIGVVPTRAASGQLDLGLAKLPDDLLRRELLSS